LGANFNFLTAKDMPQAELTRKFDDLRQRDLIENGNSYSGSWGMAQGLAFRSEHFASEAAAEEWLSEHAEKWEAALAVTYTDAGGQERYAIGAWCSS
jgi:hypothetical protein